MSWANSASTSAYIEASQATESLGEPAKGFVRISEASKANELLIKQNNFIIELLIQQDGKLDKIAEGIEALKKGKGGATGDLEVKIDELSVSLKNLGRKKDEVPATVSRVYHFEDPRKILEEVRRQKP